MCWAHVDRAIEERLRPVPDESMRESVRDNIHQLQTMHSSELFDYAYKQFVTKWSKKKIPEIDTFLEYFGKEWVESKNNKWYEGAATRVPSTDNGLEGTNAVIKHVYTLRERLSVASYMANAVNMLRNLSIDCTTEKRYQTELKVEDNTWHFARECLKNNPLIQRFKDKFILTKQRIENT